MKKYLLTLILSVMAVILVAQTSSPKREMRSGWLATVWNLDWPSVEYKISSKDDVTMIQYQKEQLKGILDKMKDANVNTVFLQVRSRCDALYESSYEPWSSDIVKTRGTDPGYDPLAFAIEEAHKRGLELHTWINPYRYESTTGSWSADDVYNKTHPEWLLRVKRIDSEGKVVDARILDPGLPEVRQRIVDIVKEIVTNYDIDGVAFDDYFYLQGITTEDAKTANEYKPANVDLKDWRRSNVNQMIADVHAAIKSIKPYVQFGVSPAGIWDGGNTVAAEYGVEIPSDLPVNGFQYNGIYSDPLAWMKEKTVDYISPQIYWATTNSTAPYTPLSKWWSYLANLFGVHFYASHSLSGITNIPSTKSLVTDDEVALDTNTYGSMSQLEELLLRESSLVETRATKAVASDYLLQVAHNRNFDKNGAPGSVFYSVKYFSGPYFSSFLKNNIFQNPALRPALWSADGQEEFVSNIRVEGSALKWDYSGLQKRFTVYAIPKAKEAEVGNFASSDYLLGVVYSENSFAIPEEKPSSDYTYAVAVFDRFNNEYSPKLLGKDEVKTGSAPVLEYPLNNGGIVMPSNFSWKAEADAEFYILEVASDAAFSDIIYRREVKEAFLSGENLSMLRSGSDYYWRVTTRRVSTNDAVSPIYAFKAALFSILSPNVGDETNVTPVVSWLEITGATKYTIEISTRNGAGFNLGVVFTKETTDTSYTIDEKVLAYGTQYYVRVKVSLATTEVESDIVGFKTKVEMPLVPVILSPVNGQEIVGSKLTVQWAESEYASGFEVELSTSSSFPVRDTETKMVKAYTYETTYTGLTLDKTHYLRVRAYSGTIKTDWSEVVTISTKTSSIEDEDMAKDDIYVRVEGNEAYMYLSNNENKLVSAALYDISGKKVEDVAIRYTPTQADEKLLVPSYYRLPSGIYILKASVGAKVFNIKVLK